MGSKVIALIVFAGMTASGLLAIRQARISAAHDMAMLHRELVLRRQDVQAMHVMVQEQLEAERLRLLVHEYENESGIRMVSFNREQCVLRCLPGVNVALMYPEMSEAVVPADSSMSSAER